MNREKFAWITSIVLLAVLAFQLPGSLAQRDDDYSFVRTLVDIHRQVATNYVEPVDEDKLRQAAIEGMLSELDPFTVYVPPAKEEDFDRMLEGTFKGVGIRLDQHSDDGPIEVVTPIEGSPAFKAGVQAGDIILKVNGENVEGQRLPDVIKKISGPLGSEVALTVHHPSGAEADLKMTREEIVVPVITGYQRKYDGSWDYFVSHDQKVAYVRLSQFTADSAASLRAVLTPLLAQGMKGLILDLRFNPGGRLEEAVDMVDMFVNKGVIVTTRGRNRPEHSFTATGNNTLPYFPMIVLVNEHSASASEIVSGSLQDNHRAVVVGTRTFGKGSVQEVIPLDSKGGELKLTVAYYYLPSGRLVHRKKDATDWGVDPQIVVPVDQNGEEQVLESRYEAEIIKGPTTNPVTQPSTATAPTTQPVDVQLQRALDTMVAVLVMQGGHNDVNSILSAAPTTMPATMPATTRASQ